MNGFEELTRGEAVCPRSCLISKLFFTHIRREPFRLTLGALIIFQEIVFRRCEVLRLGKSCLAFFLNFTRIITNPTKIVHNACHGHSLLAFFLVLGVVLATTWPAAAQSRSTYISYDSSWVGGPDSKWMALDTAHQQIFTAWPALDRVDVLSTTDYHLIRSIVVPSPSTLDISPDRTTLAVGTSGSHILFFNTATYAKAGDLVFPGSGIGITAFLYTANGNAMIRAAEGLSTGGGITAYWDHTTNSFLNTSNAEAPTTSIYQTTGPLARSGDYSKIMLGDASSAGAVQIIDGNTGNILFTNAGGGMGFGGYIYSLAANNNASRYAVCFAITTQTLVILDSNFNQIYQDQNGCLGMTFSADGNSLYRDINLSSASYTQVLDMTAFTTRNVQNYFTSGKSLGYATFWQAADSTGMVYGTVPNDSSDVIWTAIDTSVSTALTPPSASTSVQLLHVIDNIGSPQGGDSIRLLCAGVSVLGNQSISVTIGGAPATKVQVFGGAIMPNEAYVTAVTPRGAPGLADVVLTVNGSSSTASHAFQYSASRTIIPFSTNPTFLLYDAFRNCLYASHGNQVEVIDVASQTLLAPLLPASGKLANSLFEGLSLSPDGNRLYIADAGAGMIHILNLNSPGTGSSINVGNAVGYSASVTPGRVFELSTGMVLGSSGNGLFLIDPSTGKGDWARDANKNTIFGYAWSSTSDGQNILLSQDGDGLIWSYVGLWNANSSSNATPSAETQWIEETSISGDGTVIAAGGSTPGIEEMYPELVDSDLHAIGLIKQHFDVQLPVGTPSFFLHPSGALLYKAGTNDIGGTSFPGSTVEIDDTHLYQPAASVVFPEPFVTSYTPFTQRMLAIDSTGRYIFGVTQSGITIMQLNSVPLSIGNIQPAFIQPLAGQTVTIRGSGFAPGATVTIGGSEAAANYVDANTLSVEAPAISSGWADVTVKLASGDSYTAPGLLQVIGTQPTPLVTGFSPASIVVQSGIPGFDTASTVTVLGSGFESYDTVEINGQQVAGAFIDDGHYQATIPSNLTGQAGNLSVSVISPYAGSSNTLALAMINPVPVLEDNVPRTIVPGSSLGLNIYGTGFVSGSILQWNGQNLSAYLIGGKTTSGLESVYAMVPASLTSSAGTAIVTVFNPAPGGGVSNPFLVDVSAAHPTLFLTLISSNNSVATPFYTFPTSIDFGTSVLNNSINDSLYLQNIGDANYVFSSASVSPGAFTLQPFSCPALAPPPVNNTCVMALSFTPSSEGVTSAILTITDNATGSPHTITLTGTSISTPVPAVTLTSINSIGDFTTAYVRGTTVVGGTSIAGTAWIEYGTDPALNTYSQSTPWTFTGDGALSGNLTNLVPGTQYAARLAVKTAGGTGKSAINLFSTLAAPPWVAMSLPTGASGTTTVKAGSTATWTLNASDGGNGYTGTATFTCTGAPTGATCTVSPSQIALSTTALPITITATTTAATTAQASPTFGGFSLALCLLFGTGVLAFRGRLRNAGWLLCLAILALSAVSCGGGGSGGGGGTQVFLTPTPPGTYYLTVNATAGTAKNTYLLSLIVQ
jgi:hypothetical protein